MLNHSLAQFHRAPFVSLAFQDQGWCDHIRAGDTAGRVIGNCSAEPLGEVLCRQIAVIRVERRIAAQRLSKDGHSRRIDVFHPRQVAQRRVGVERLAVP